MIDYESKILARQEAIEMAEDSTCIWDCERCEFGRVVYRPDLRGDLVETYECSFFTEED